MGKVRNAAGLPLRGNGSHEKTMSRL